MNNGQSWPLVGFFRKNSGFFENNFFPWKTLSLNRSKRWPWGWETMAVWPKKNGRWDLKKIGHKPEKMAAFFFMKNSRRWTSTRENRPVRYSDIGDENETYPIQPTPTASVFVCVFFATAPWAPGTEGIVAGTFIVKKVTKFSKRSAPVQMTPPPQMTLRLRPETLAPTCPHWYHANCLKDNPL